MSVHSCGILHMDPSDVRTFTMDWRLQLGTDTIAGSAWVVPAALTVVASGVTPDGQMTTLTLSGGVPETDYLCTNTIQTTTSTETLQRSGTLRVHEL